MAIVLRSVKGSALTFSQLDNNFSELDSRILDSAEVSDIIDSDYIQSRQLLTTPAEGLDSAAVIDLVDSDYIEARFGDTFDSDYVKARMLSLDGGVLNQKYGEYIHDPNPIVFSVVVSSKTSAHRYQGTGSSNGYVIEGTEGPFIELVPGNTYQFDQSDASNSFHPL